jgi:hypothetical protein
VLVASPCWSCVGAGTSAICLAQQLLQRPELVTGVGGGESEKGGSPFWTCVGAGTSAICLAQQLLQRAALMAGRVEEWCICCCHCAQQKLTDSSCGHHGNTAVAI